MTKLGGASDRFSVYVYDVEINQKPKVLAFGQKLRFWQVPKCCFAKNWPFGTEREFLQKGTISAKIAFFRSILALFWQNFETYFDWKSRDAFFWLRLVAFRPKLRISKLPLSVLAKTLTLILWWGCTDLRYSGEQNWPHMALNVEAWEAKGGGTFPPIKAALSIDKRLSPLRPKGREGWPSMVHQLWFPPRRSQL